jgi:CrcB protein
MIKNLLIVGLGGGAGCMLRYAVQKIFQHNAAVTFPTGTVIVNITGCFLIGVLWSWLGRSLNWSEELKLLLMTGFCGGFTTFSAFTLEGMNLLLQQRVFLFLLYFAASVFIGLGATFLGYWVTSKM